MKALADNINKFESQHGEIKDVDPTVVTNEFWRTNTNGLQFLIF